MKNTPPGSTGRLLIPLFWWYIPYTTTLFGHKSIFSGDLHYCLPNCSSPSQVSRISIWKATPATKCSQDCNLSKGSSWISEGLTLGCLWPRNGLLWSLYLQDKGKAFLFSWMKSCKSELRHVCWRLVSIHWPSFKLCAACWVLETLEHSQNTEGKSELWVLNGKRQCSHSTILSLWQRRKLHLSKVYWAPWDSHLRTSPILHPSPNGRVLDNFETWGYAILYQFLILSLFQSSIQQFKV